MNKYTHAELCNKLQKVFEKQLLELSLMEDQNEALWAYSTFFCWLLNELNERKDIVFVGGVYNRALEEIRSKHSEKHFRLYFANNLTNENYALVVKTVTNNIPYYRQKFLGNLAHQVFVAPEVSPFSHPFQG
jgi:hypothetical protein